MAVRIESITFDCRHAGRLAEFWSAVLDRPIDEGQAGSEEFFASIGRSGSERPIMMFIQVPEEKAAKNRVHLDLDATDRAAEVDRLVGLGATVVHDKDEWGTRWTTLLDPEGNEFCIAAH